ncbi:hypothetical protein QL285_012875 [Trifolium repens]|nr:hypothetical protein QL285_012875 [Trifolium repens]
MDTCQQGSIFVVEEYHAKLIVYCLGVKLKTICFYIVLKLSNVGRNLIFDMKWSIIKDKVKLSQISSFPFSYA